MNKPPLGLGGTGASDPHVGGSIFYFSFFKVRFYITFYIVLLKAREAFADSEVFINVIMMLLS
jgi:hypothetical protein